MVWDQIKVHFFTFRVKLTSLSLKKSLVVYKTEHKFSSQLLKITLWYRTRHIGSSKEKYFISIFMVITQIKRL